MLLVAFFACEVGQRLTNSFDGLNGAISHLNWYLLPIEIQRLLPVIVMNVREPVVIRCFGSVLCSRAQFRKVSSAIRLSSLCVHALLNFYF